MSFATLISPEQLASHLDDDHWRIIDCRFSLTDVTAGSHAYSEGHIPGALYAHLDNDLSSPITQSSGRHPLPSRDSLVDLFSRWGIDQQTNVVVYDANNGMIATRLWWLLRWMGHKAVALLDGGLARWQREGYPVTGTTPTITLRHFIAASPLEEFISSEELLGKLGQPDHLLVDVRAPERFRGEVEPLDPVAGHIPGALNLPLQITLDSDGNFLSPEQLKTLFQSVLPPHTSGELAVMCGSGVTACHTLLALRIAEIEEGKLYAGSWSEWISDAKRPVAKGSSD